MELETLTEILNKLKLVDTLSAKVESLERQVIELQREQLHVTSEKLSGKEHYTTDDAADAMIFHYKKQPCKR